MQNTTSEIIAKIYSMIESGEKIESFSEYYHVLSQKTNLPVISISNDLFFRARKDNGKIIDHIEKIRYPPTKCARKNRLNDEGEPMTYLSTGQIATLAELDIGYYEIYCTANIKYIKKDILFHQVGINTEKNKFIEEKINNVYIFYRDLITSKDKKVYNATIALGRHLFRTNGFKVGILYSSVHYDKSNQNLFNVAIQPSDFDECCEIRDLEYNILRFSPKDNSIIIETINKGKPLKNGSIKWELSYNDMLEQTYNLIDGEIFKVDGAIIHFKFGGGRILDQTDESYRVKFVRLNEIKEIRKTDIRDA